MSAEKESISDMAERISLLNAELQRRESEIEGLRSELQRVTKRAHDLEGSRRAMLYMLEDLNESTAEKTRLYERIKEEVEVSNSLLTMAETLNTSLEEKDLIRNVLELAPRYMKFDRIGVLFYDEPLRRFTFSGGYGFSSVEEGMLLSRSYKEKDIPALAGLLKGETVIVNDSTEDAQAGSEIVDIFGRSHLVMVPISFRGRILGGLFGNYRAVREIDKKDVSLLKGLAHGIAIALQNSRLYRESVERLMELTGKIETIKTMAQLDKEILSTIDKHGILDTATALVNRIIPCERASVSLRDRGECRVISEWGAGKFNGKSYSLSGCSCQSIERSRSSVYLSDISSDNCPYHADLAALGIKSALMVPLVVKSEVIGFLDIATMHQGILTPAHLTNAENIASQITVALENSRLYEELQQLLISTITSLASAIDAKSPWTKGHSERVTLYAIEIGKEMGLSHKEIEDLRLAGLLHDVGKIGTYDALLDKPGSFTPEEFELVKQHPRKGVDILSPIKQLEQILPAILHHHERMDGKGYPEGLSGEEIPLCARILSVADSFDAMTADRPYRISQGKEYAVSEFKRCAGTQFDARVVEAFLKVLDRSRSGIDK